MTTNCRVERSLRHFYVCLFIQYTTAEYLTGYAGMPPMVHLRRGETLRRYLQPGLNDGKTFVFWGRNHKTEVTTGKSVRTHRVEFADDSRK